MRKNSRTRTLPGGQEQILSRVCVTNQSARKSLFSGLVYAKRGQDSVHTTQVDSVLRAFWWATLTRDSVRCSPVSEAAVASQEFLPVYYKIMPFWGYRCIRKQSFTSMSMNSCWYPPLKYIPNQWIVFFPRSDWLLKLGIVSDIQLRAFSGFRARRLLHFSGKKTCIGNGVSANIHHYSPVLR